MLVHVRSEIREEIQRRRVRPMQDPPRRSTSAVRDAIGAKRSTIASNCSCFVAAGASCDGCASTVRARRGSARTGGERTRGKGPDRSATEIRERSRRTRRSGATCRPRRRRRSARSRLRRSRLQPSLAQVCELLAPSDERPAKHRANDHGATRFARLPRRAYHGAGASAARVRARAACPSGGVERATRPPPRSRARG